MWEQSIFLQCVAWVCCVGAASISLLWRATGGDKPHHESIKQNNKLTNLTPYLYRDSLDAIPLDEFDTQEHFPVILDACFLHS